MLSKFIKNFQYILLLQSKNLPKPHNFKKFLGDLQLKLNSNLKSKHPKKVQVSLKEENHQKTPQFVFEITHKIMNHLT